MPVFAPYNPRRRYLSALGQVSPSVIPGGRYWWTASPAATGRTMLVGLGQVAPVGPGGAYWWMNPTATGRTLGMGAPTTRVSAFHIPASQAASLYSRVAAPYAVPASRRRRMQLAQDDSQAFDWTGAIQEMQSAPAIPAQTSSAYQAQVAAAGQMLAPTIAAGSPAPPIPAGTYGSVASPGTSVTFMPSGAEQVNIPIPKSTAIAAPVMTPVAAAAPTTASWFSAANPSLGISNGLLLAGIGAIALVVLVSSSRSKR